MGRAKPLSPEYQAIFLLRGEKHPKQGLQSRWLRTAFPARSGSPQRFGTSGPCRSVAHTEHTGETGMDPLGFLQPCLKTHPIVLVFRYNPYAPKVFFRFVRFAVTYVAYMYTYRLLSKCYCSTTTPQGQRPCLFYWQYPRVETSTSFRSTISHFQDICNLLFSHWPQLC